MNTIGQISEINFEIGEIFIFEWTLSLIDFFTGILKIDFHRSKNCFMSFIIFHPIGWKSFYSLKLINFFFASFI